MTDSGGPGGGFAARLTYPKRDQAESPNETSWNAVSVEQATRVVDVDRNAPGPSFS